MKKVTLISLAILITVVITGVGVFFMSGGSLESEADIGKASAEFKANPGFRQHVANKLIPHLEIGMTTQEVENLLGKPDSISTDGIHWRYGLFYSQFIDISFDCNGKLVKMHACASAESDVRDNPTGIYKLEK